MYLEAYLFFNGNCEEAINFYQDVFSGEIEQLNRYEGSPIESDVPADYKQKIMHATLKTPQFKLMAADSHRHDGTGSRISLSVWGHDADEAKRVFTQLAEGGTVRMPFDKVFWGGLYGMVTDKFGIEWMVSSA